MSLSQHFLVLRLVSVLPSAQQLESEFISPLHVTETQSVLFDEGLVEMSVDETLLQEMSVVAG